MISYDQVPSHARVWVYQSNHSFTEEQVKTIDNELQEFADQWSAHQVQLSAFGKIYHNLFVVVMVDEAIAAASGCSIDSSVHFVQSLEKRHNISLFDRLNIAYRSEEGIELADQTAFENKASNGEITADTIVFNNLVKDKSDFESSWELPASKTWVARLLPQLSE